MRFKSHALTVVLAAAAFAAPAQAMPDNGPVTSNEAGFGSSHAAQMTRAESSRPRGGSASVQPQIDVVRAPGIDRLPGPPTWPEDPQPIAPAHTVSAEPAGSDGPPWDTIALGLAGAALALTVAGTFAGMRRRSHRPRVAA